MFESEMDSKESCKRAISEEAEGRNRRKRKSRPRRIDATDGGDDIESAMMEIHDNCLFSENTCLEGTIPLHASEDESVGPEDESNSHNDPHKLHFEYELPEGVIKDHSNLYENEKEMKWPSLGTFYVTDQGSEGIPIAIPLCLKNGFEDFHLKENLRKICMTSPVFKEPGKLSPLQLEVYSAVGDYYDLMFCNRTAENGEELRAVYCLHLMNHILKAKAKIIHHSAKIAKNPDEEYRDQGFTRPLVLVLVPFREDCMRIVKMLSALLPEATVMNKSRFEKEYGSEAPPQRLKPKPADFDVTFAGNTDEDFKIGLKIKNKSISLYSEFYSSDLLIASPLGLRQVVGAEGDKNRDFDFLSSIEILIIDRADVLLMQNWYHLIHVLNHINLLPREPRSCNFFRVRTYALDELAKFYKQTLLFSAVEHGWFKALFSHGQCVNHAGYLRTWCDVDVPSVCKVALPVPQVFRRFDTELPVTDLDDRFNFFTTQVLPQFKEPEMAGTLIYVPSYFDFVRLRNYFRDNELSCTMVCEYSKGGKVAQARDLFFHGYRHFMLYTERAHFYNRYRIKGMQHIIFYQLPTFPHFYEEMCNLFLHSNPKRKDDLLAENTCTIIVSKYDCLQLKHVAGMNKAKHILSSEKNVFMVRTKDE